MAKRLQPSLLDRLTDDEPERKMEAAERRGASSELLRQNVRRDLAWLFNTVNFVATEDLTAHPEVASSVLNYGVADLTGKSLSSVDIKATERMLREAILRYEPRLIPKSVRVELVGEREQIRYNQLCFNIHAQLWAEPLPLRLVLRTELNLETGDVSVSETANAEVA